MSEHVDINNETDIVKARNNIRHFAKKLGFSMSEQIKISIAVSELARNIIKYADHGWVEASEHNEAGKNGIKLVVKDQGPGIPDIEQAKIRGFTTSRSLGMGLSAVEAAVDIFEIESQINVGTTITCVKWRN